MVSLNFWRAIFFNLLFLLYIIQLIFPLPYANVILSICSLFAFLISLPGTQLFYRIIVIVSLSLSFIIMYFNHLFTWRALTYFSGMTNILVLLAYASLFAIPVVLGAYPQKIYKFFKYKVTSFKSMYTTFSIVTFLLSSVMAASSIPTIQASLSKFLKQIPSTMVKKFQSVTFVRPFIMTLFWTPVAAAPTITITGTGANAAIVLSISFTIAILFLVFDILTCKLRMPNAVVVEMEMIERKYAPSKKNNKSLLYFLLNILLFIILILALGHYLHYSIIDAVVMMLIPYSFIWSIMLRRGRKYIANVKDRLNNNVPKIYPQVALFISFSLLINVLEQSNLNESINQSVHLLGNSIGPFILVFIGIVVFMISWTGIIPQLVVVLATQTLSAEVLNVSPEWLALAILGGALTGSTSSPFTINANIVAVTIDESPLGVVKHNLIFALFILIVTSSLSVILQIFVG